MIDIAKTALSPEPDERPSDARELAAEITRHLEDVQERLKQVELARVEAQTRTEEERRRKKLYLAVAGLMLVLAAGAGVGAVWFNRLAVAQTELADRNKLVAEQQTDLANQQQQLADERETRRREAVQLRLQAEDGERRAESMRLAAQSQAIKNELPVQSVLVALEAVKVTPRDGTIDQKDCMYAPRVQGIRAGQTLQIVNSDKLTHNVRSFPTRNRPFNLGQIGVGTREKIFKRPEREVVEFRCDIHRWMLAWVFVLDHPFYGATAEDGSYQIADLPEGEYTVVAWHEEFGEQKQKIEVGGEGAIEVNFTFPALEE